MNSPFIVAVIALIGVAIGASIGLLSPIIQRRIEQNKRRNLLKTELVYNLTLYFSYHKLVIRESNAANYQLQKLELQQKYFDGNPHIEGPLKDNVLMKMDSFNKEFKASEAKANMDFEKMIDIGAKLNAISLESSYTFDDKKIAKGIKLIVNRVLDQPSMNVFDFTTIDADTMKNIIKVLREKVNQRIIDSENEFQKINSELETLFS